MEIQASNWIDYGILALIGISVLMAVFRGFVRETISLVTWVAAIVLALQYCMPISAYFTQISLEILRVALAFVLIALSVLIAGGIASHLTLRLIKFTGFGMTDRIIGLPFGIGRGALAVAMILVIFLPSSITKNPLWQESSLIPRFVPLSFWIKDSVYPVAKSLVPLELTQVVQQWLGGSGEMNFGENSLSPLEQTAAEQTAEQTAVPNDPPTISTGGSNPLDQVNVAR